jgi:hypothetical protein
MIIKGEATADTGADEYQGKIKELEAILNDSTG